MSPNGFFLVCQNGEGPTFARLNKAAFMRAKLRVTFSKNQRNHGHSSKFNLAHTLSIDRPRSHTYYKDVRLLKFSLVWEKST